MDITGILEQHDPHFRSLNSSGQLREYQTTPELCTCGWAIKIDYRLDLGGPDHMSLGFMGSFQIYLLDRAVTPILNRSISLNDQEWNLRRSK